MSSFHACCDGPSGLLCSCCWGRGSHLELRLEPQASSPGLTWISRFLSGIHRGVKTESCGAMQVSSSLQLEKQCQASCWVNHRYQWLSLEVPQGCHTCHSVLSWSSGLPSHQCWGVRCVWSALGHRVFLEMVAQPLEFLSTFKRRPPPHDVQRECRDSLPNEAGQGTLLSG